MSALWRLRVVRSAVVLSVLLGAGACDIPQPSPAGPVITIEVFPLSNGKVNGGGEAFTSSLPQESKIDVKHGSQYVSITASATADAGLQDLTLTVPPHDTVTTTSPGQALTKFMSIEGSSPTDPTVPGGQLLATNFFLNDQIHFAVTATATDKNGTLHSLSVILDAEVPPTASFDAYYSDPGDSTPAAQSISLNRSTFPPVSLKWTTSGCVEAVQCSATINFYKGVVPPVTPLPNSALPPYQIKPSQLAQGSVDLTDPSINLQWYPGGMYTLYLTVSNESGSTPPLMVTIACVST
jgi:hypothetical protein